MRTNIACRLQQLKSELPKVVRLVAVSKLQSMELIREAYDAGQRLFGENRVQELLLKYETLPKDIMWHFIGHLQLNKVKYIAPFIDTIQSADTLKVLEEINKQAIKYNRHIRVLLQIHIAREKRKFGFSFDEAESIVNDGVLQQLMNLDIIGLMGIATFTNDTSIIQNEFSTLSAFFKRLQTRYFTDYNHHFRELSIGMSSDYPLALEEGTTMIRIGTKLFGNRIYK